jgi:putative phosphonate metabolism protein
MTARYAIYFSPAQDSPWWAFGAHWLGRDEFGDVPLAQPALTPLLSADLSAITSEPRRYGFHATLKAPFHLNDRHSAEGVLERLRALAATLRPVALGPLHAVTLGNFVALVPALVPEGLQALAAACVKGLDDLRAPLSQAGLARRRIEHLDERECMLLQLFGYPYVLDRFRLHFTLSGPVDPSVAQRIIQVVADPVARLNAVAPLVLDRLCLFVEAAPGRPFRRVADVGLPP